MPALSPTMTAGNIASWKRAEGEAINAGEVIAEVETDKATVDYEMTDDGFIAKILVPEGAQDVAVGSTLAVIVDSSDLVSAFKDFTIAASEPAAASSTTPTPNAHESPPAATPPPSSPPAATAAPIVAPIASGGSKSYWNQTRGWFRA